MPGLFLPTWIRARLDESRLAVSLTTPGQSGYVKSQQLLCLCCCVCMCVKTCFCSWHVRIRFLSLSCHESLWIHTCFGCCHRPSLSKFGLVLKLFICWKSDGIPLCIHFTNVLWLLRDSRCLGLLCVTILVFEFFARASMTWLPVFLSCSKLRLNLKVASNQPMIRESFMTVLNFI